MQQIAVHSFFCKLQPLKSSYFHKLLFKKTLAFLATSSTKHITFHCFSRVADPLGWGGGHVSFARTFYSERISEVIAKL